MTLPDPLSSIALDKAAEAVGSLAPEVYRDAIQPAAKEIGTTLGRAVRVALAPVRAVAWSWEHAETWLESAVEERFARRRIPESQIVSPRPQLAAGVIRGVQASGPEDDPTLRDMFASLLASAMDANTAAKAHPAFAEILAQITPIEGRILAELARREPSPVILRMEVAWLEGVIPEPRELIADADILTRELGVPLEEDLVEAMLDNLQRLGLVRVATETFEQTHLDAVSDTDQEFETERKERLHSFKAYIAEYGQEVAERVLTIFEQQPRQEITKLHVRVLNSERRPGLHLRLLWLSTFGTQLARSVTDPSSYGNFQGGSQVSEDHV
jgi:hypothetical protein